MIAVDLMPEWKVNDLVLTDYPYSVDADSTVDIGEPEVEVVTIPGSLADGDLEREVRSGNRTYVLSVYIEGPTMGDLAENEAALRRELKKPSVLLTHDPGDGLGFASVYEVQVARMKPDRQDLHESHLIRRVTLTFTCGPFARSVDAVTVEALAPPPVTPTTATVNNADTTTGWNGTHRLYTTSYPVAPTDEGSFVRVEGNSTRVDPTLGLSASLSVASVSLTSTPYLLVEVKTETVPSYGYNLVFKAMISGSLVTLAPVISRATTSGTTLHVLSTSGGSLTSLSISVEYPGYANGLTRIDVHDVSRTDTLPQLSNRQITRVIEVGGTERTPASLHVVSANGTDPLTQVIVHTCPEDGSGYSPPLRRWRTSDSTGPVTADSALYSGAYEPIAFASGGFYAEVPTSALPEGGYTLLARIRLSASAPANVTVFYSTSTLFPGSSIQDGFTNGSEVITMTDTEWILVPITTLSLPSVRTKAGKVQIVLQASTTHAQVYLDEAWLLREDDDCALTITNTPLAHLWLDSPDLGSPVEQVWIGDGAATRVHPSAGLVAQGRHVLSPGGTAVFTAALSDNPETDATFYRRWHSNAAG